MLIAVIDGQGGGIGKALVEKLRKQLCDKQLYEKQLVAKLEILALGTNPLATSAMLKAGATAGASGENAIVVNARRADIILGSIGIIAADAMLGEVTPAMAHAVAASDAVKILVPMNRCGIIVTGTGNRPLPDYIEEAVITAKSIIENDTGE
jgi:hypothetical protein